MITSRSWSGLQSVLFALSAAPEHQDALRVGIDAHRALDADSENFWRSSWLRHQAESLEERLA